MGHDYVDYAGRSVVFRDSMLNLIRCIMIRNANDRRVRIPYRFRQRLVQTLADFDYVCNGVFTNFKLDELLSTEKDVRDFLNFIDVCAEFVVRRGPSLSQSFLNELVGDSDQWTCAVDVAYPLLGFGRLANLVCGSESRAGEGTLPAWASDDLTARMKQQRNIEHRQNTSTNNPINRSGGSAAT